MSKDTIKILLLVIGIYLIAYTAATPGLQLWQSIGGASAIGLYISIDN